MRLNERAGKRGGKRFAEQVLRFLYKAANLRGGLYALRDIKPVRAQHTLRRGGALRLCWSGLRLRCDGRGALHVIRRKGGIQRGVNAANEAAFHPEAERGIDTLRGDAERGCKILRCIRPPVMAQKPQHDLELISVRLLDISIYKRVRHGENRAPCAELQLITHEKPPFPILNFCMYHCTTHCAWLQP